MDLSFFFVLQAVYVAVVSSASKSDRSSYDALLRVYRETDLSQEKTRILGTVSSFGNLYYDLFCSH